MGFCARAKKNGREIYQGLKLKELQAAIFFVCFNGAVIPNVADYMYYYQTDVAGFDASMMGWLSFLSC
jgi:hypothetical protein